MCRSTEFIMLRIPPLVRRIRSGMSRELYSRSHLDTTPPKYNGPLHPLDKAVFQKSIPVLAARVPASQIALILHSEVTRKYVIGFVSVICHFFRIFARYLIGLPKVRPIVSDPSAPEGDRLVLLGVSDQGEDWPFEVGV